MTLEELTDPSLSKELEQLLKALYGETISHKDLVSSTYFSNNGKLAIIKHQNEIIGYVIYIIEKEKEEEEGTTRVIQTLVVDEIVILSDYHKEEVGIELVKNLDSIGKKSKSGTVEITLPSQSFWLIPLFVQEGGYSTSILRVSKELEKKTEFVQIYTSVEKGMKPELIELMVSEGDNFQLEIIEEPKDYRRIIEGGFTPEIVSMLFYVEEENLEEFFKNVNSIAAWQEYTFSLVKKL
ncbi:MAG: hypothetical protein ACXABK_03670 [Candidatus Heimdallarchaeaceae archaeon]|jgi:hypothetical protein